MFWKRCLRGEHSGHYGHTQRGAEIFAFSSNFSEWKLIQIADNKILWRIQQNKKKYEMDLVNDTKFNALNSNALSK